MSSDKIYQRKSLLIINSGGVYIYTKNVDIDNEIYLRDSEKYFKKSALDLNLLAISTGRSRRFLPTRIYLYACLSPFILFF